MLYMIASSNPAHATYLNRFGKLSEGQATHHVARMNHYLRMHGVVGPFYITPVLDV